MTLRTALAAAVATLALLPASALADTAPDDASSLYLPSTVLRVDLTMPQASIDALEAEPDEYVVGTFALEEGAETFGPLEVGIRLKGQASARGLDQKAAFKIKVDEFVKGQRFRGLRKLTLNNMVQDPSQIHETLAYEAFRAAGVPAPRTGYAFVTVNGVAYGLYLDIENLDSISLPRWFDSTSHLYEASYETDVEPGDIEAFEADEGKSSKREDLEALVAAANDTEGDWSDGMAGLADLEEMTRMWAVERYIGHGDGYSADVGYGTPNNYYLHSEESGLFRMLPWGTDQTWEEHLSFDGASKGLLFQRCLEDESCAAMYRKAVRGVIAAIDSLDLGAQATSLAALLAPWEEIDPRREVTPEEIEAGVEKVEDFIASRPAEASDWVGPLPAEEGPGGDPGPEPEDPVPPIVRDLPPALTPTPTTYATTRPSNRFGLGAIARRRAGTSLRVHVPGPGRLTLSGPGLRTVVVDASAAGTAKLALTPTGAARRRLAEVGVVGLRASVTFAPSGGDPATRSRSLKLIEWRRWQNRRPSSSS